MSKKEQPTTEETKEQVTIKVEKKPKKKRALRGNAKKVAELEELKTELEQEVGELKDKFIRQTAEFDNYKKRTARERVDLFKNAAQETIGSLLPVLDDFDRAIQAGESDDTIEPVSEGMKMIYNRLKTTLGQKGLKAMETTGETFDPELHEALTEIPAPSEEMKGKIIDTIEKGYYLNDKIIRYARVVVGK